MITPLRKYGSDEEARLAAELNDLGDKMLARVDAACRLRTAPGDAKRLRALMKNDLQAAIAKGMDALAYTIQPEEGA